MIFVCPSISLPRYGNYGTVQILCTKPEDGGRLHGEHRHRPGRAIHLRQSDTISGRGQRAVSAAIPAGTTGACVAVSPRPRGWHATARWARQMATPI